MINPLKYISSLRERRRQRKWKNKMYKEMNKCLLDVARKMDDFGDELIKGK